MKKKYHNAVQELLAQNPTRTFKAKELARKIGIEKPDYSKFRNGIKRLAAEGEIAGFAGIVLVYAFLFGIGKIVFGEALIGLLYLGTAALSGFVIYRHFTKSGWETLSD